VNLFSVFMFLVNDYIITTCPALVSSYFKRGTWVNTFSFTWFHHQWSILVLQWLAHILKGDMGLVHLFSFDFISPSMINLSLLVLLCLEHIVKGKTVFNPGLHPFYITLTHLKSLWSQRIWFLLWIIYFTTFI